MVIIPSINFIKRCFDEQFSKINSNCRLILHNHHHKFLIQKDTISHMESSVANLESFQASIVELSDTGRILSSESMITKDDDYIINIISDNEKVTSNHHIINVTEQSHDILFTLIVHNEKTLSFSDFSKDDDIKEFIEKLISLIKYPQKILIVNRELRHKFIDGLKIVNYYTLNTYKDFNISFKSDVSDWRKKLPKKKIKVFFTRDRRKIHERKIIIGDLILTLDNDFDNITVKEETWILNLKYDKKLADILRQKLKTFSKFTL